MFRCRANGYEFLSQGGRLEVCLDVQDGVLFEMKQDWDFEALLPEMRITQAQAIDRTAAAYNDENARLGRPSRGAPDAGRIKLGYAVPNGRFGAPKGFEVAPFRAGLAYQIPFGPDRPDIGNDFVWIDAATGEVLGGQLGSTG